MSGEHPEALLMKAVDGLLSQAERGELERHLEGCPDCREELSDFDRIKQTTDAMTARILRDASIEPPTMGMAARGMVGFGWLAILVGLAMVLGFAGYALASDVEVPLYIKLAIAVVALGFIVLLTHVLRIRLGARGRDPYQEIDQ